MKALSLLQPWASLIAIGAKRWETRSWRTSYRGEIAIHASQRFGKELFHISTEEPFLSTLSEAGIATPSGIPRSAIIAVANIVEVIPTGTLFSLNSLPDTAEFEEEFGNYEPGRFAWKLENVRRLKTPVPCGGALSIWSVPDETANAISDQLRLT